MRDKIQSLTPDSLLSIAQPSGELFYYDGSDSLGIAEIFTDTASFAFIDAEEKAHASNLIQKLLANNQIVQTSSILYKLTGNCYRNTQSGRSVTSDVIAEDILEIKPNFFGIGINMNSLFRKYRK